MPNPDGTPDVFSYVLRGDDDGLIQRRIGDGPLETLFTPDVEGMREVFIDHVGVTKGVTDALKISGVKRLRVVVGVLDGRGATEDAVDINHSHDVELVVSDLYAGDRYCATIKGASTNIKIVVVCQHGHGSETDYDYGNFSDTDNGKTTGCTLAIGNNDCSDVRVRVLSADKPTLIDVGPEYRVNTTMRGWFYGVFNFFKDLLRTFGVKV